MKVRIIKAALDIFQEKGLKFTMDELSHHLNMSKKTIYTIFPSKEELLVQTVHYCFDCIALTKHSIIIRTDLDLVTKIKYVIIALPESFKGIEFNSFYIGKEKYPLAYEAAKERLETNWDDIIALLQLGIDTHILKPFSIPVFKAMVEASFERFLSTQTLLNSNITYRTALNEMANILIDGIVN